MQTRVSPQSVWPDLGVSASPSRARSNRAARLTWSRQPRGRPAGLPDRPLANRPRRCRASCFPCFIWSRSGIGNSFNRNCTRLRVPTPRRLQCEYGDWMIIYLSSPLRANRQQADCETLIGTRSFLSLGEIVAELNRVPGVALRAKAHARITLRGAVGREDSTVPPASMAEPGFAEPKRCRRISHIACETKKPNRFCGRIMLHNSCRPCGNTGGGAAGRYINPPRCAG